MIVEFKKHNYIDINNIMALRWIEPRKEDTGWGVVFVGGQKMAIEADEFDIIEKAFIWQHGYSIYDKDLKKRGMK